MNPEFRFYCKECGVIKLKPFFSNLDGYSYVPILCIHNEDIARDYIMQEMGYTDDMKADINLKIRNVKLSHCDVEEDETSHIVHYIGEYACWCDEP